MKNLRQEKSSRYLGNKKSLKSTKKIQVKATIADWNKWKTEFQGLKTKKKRYK
jgi:hypothetical protein